MLFTKAFAYILLIKYITIALSGNLFLALTYAVSSIPMIAKSKKAVGHFSLYCLYGLCYARPFSSFHE